MFLILLLFSHCLLSLFTLKKNVNYNILLQKNNNNKSTYSSTILLALLVFCHQYMLCRLLFLSTRIFLYVTTFWLYMFDLLALLVGIDNLLALLLPLLQLSLHIVSIALCNILTLNILFIKGQVITLASRVLASCWLLLTIVGPLLNSISFLLMITVDT